MEEDIILTHEDILEDLVQRLHEDSYPEQKEGDIDVTTLCVKTGLSRDQVKKKMRKLVASGDFVEAKVKGAGSCPYKLVWRKEI